MIQKAKAFRALHDSSEILVLANTGDVGTSRLVVEAGFPAVATTSSGLAWALGYADGEHISREEMFFMVSRIAASVSVPVSADMEAGYGPAPEDVAETVGQAMAAGVVGVNIEDTDRQQSSARAPGLLPFELSVDRIRAAREAGDRDGVGMVINARTDSFLRFGPGDQSFAETVRRANAFRQVGADCLFVPGVHDEQTITALVREIDGPINILAGVGCPPVPRLEQLGVARVSIGGLFSLASATLVQRACAELRDTGTYGFAVGNLGHDDMDRLSS